MRDDRGRRHDRPNLLDSTGRRIVVQDRTAAIEILLPAGAAGPPVGSRVRVAGEIGQAYGAPRIRGRRSSRLGRQAPKAARSPRRTGRGPRVAARPGPRRRRRRPSIRRSLAGGAARRRHACPDPRAGRRRDPGLRGRRGPDGDGRRHRPAAVSVGDRSSLRGPAAFPARPDDRRAGGRLGSTPARPGLGASGPGRPAGGRRLRPARQPGRRDVDGHRSRRDRRARRPDGPRRRARRRARGRRVPARRRHGGRPDRPHGRRRSTTSRTSRRTTP